ncbi:MAG: serine protease [Phycisphaerae bacterium]
MQRLTNSASLNHPVRGEFLDMVICLAPYVALVGALAPTAPAWAQTMKPEIEEKVKSATVMVFTKSSRQTRGDTTLETGSGFFVNGTGLAITNNHVVDPSHSKTPLEQMRFHYATGKLHFEVVVNAGTGEQQPYTAEVIYQNRAADQAVLQVFSEPGKKLVTRSYLRLQPESRLREGVRIWALGFPGGDSQRSSRRRDHPPVTITPGRITRIPRTPGGRVRMIHTNAEVRPGNSGGPMVDQDGFLVGTATLMTPPEGYEFSGGVTNSALVPAKITAQMIRYAFDLGRMKQGTDVVPFMDILTDEDGRIIVPEFRRLPDRDTLFFPDGDRINGTISTSSIKWESDIGLLEIPTEAVAYVMASSDGAHLFMEGGNHISASHVDAGFQFAPRAGTVLEQKFEDVGTVAFRQSDRQLREVKGDAIVLDTNVCHLVLSKGEGEAKFDSRAGVIDVSLPDIERIDSESRSTKIITFSDGSRLTGSFEESLFHGVIAATGTPIDFDLGNVDFATVELVQVGGTGVAGLDLPGVMGSADRALVRIARGLNSKDWSQAFAALEAWLAPERFKRLPLDDRERVSLLEAIALLRKGDYGEATRAFRKGVRSNDENVAAYSQACLDVLKTYEDGQFDGGTLSDPATFVKAGTKLARGLIAEVREYLKGADFLEGRNRGEYIKHISRIEKLEAAMATAAIFVGEEADDELIQLWKSAARAAAREVSRIDEKKAEKGKAGSRRAPPPGPGGRRGRAVGGAQAARERKARELEEQRAEAVATRKAYVVKLYEYGFRIDDPDIRALHERQGEQDVDGGP